jgi:hypothetical protein
MSKELERILNATCSNIVTYTELRIQRRWITEHEGRLFGSVAKA